MKNNLEEYNPEEPTDDDFVVKKVCFVSYKVMGVSLDLML